jgi:hypothetical protein
MESIDQVRSILDNRNLVAALACQFGAKSGRKKTLRQPRSFETASDLWYNLGSRPIVETAREGLRHVPTVLTSWGF